MESTSGGILFAQVPFLCYLANTQWEGWSNDFQLFSEISWRFGGTFCQFNTFFPGQFYEGAFDTFWHIWPSCVNRTNTKPANKFHVNCHRNRDRERQWMRICIETQARTLLFTLMSKCNKIESTLHNCFVCLQLLPNHTTTWNANRHSKRAQWGEWQRQYFPSCHLFLSHCLSYALTPKKKRKE